MSNRNARPMYLWSLWKHHQWIATAGTRMDAINAAYKVGDITRNEHAQLVKTGARPPAQFVWTHPFQTS